MKPYSINLPALILLFALAAPVGAMAASRVTDQEVSFFNSKAESCGNQFKGKQLIGCLATAMSGLGSGLKRADIPQKAPRAAPSVRSTASRLRSAASKAAATAVLNRARSVMRGLAAKSSGQTKMVYNSVARAYSRAVSVIRRKY